MENFPRNPQSIFNDTSSFMAQSTAQPQYENSKKKLTRGQLKLQKKKLAKNAIKDTEEMNKEIQNQENLKEWIAEILA